jgi:hypothetical protein
MRQERLLSVGTDGGGYINLLCTNKDDLSLWMAGGHGAVPESYYTAAAHARLFTLQPPSHMAGAPGARTRNAKSSLAFSLTRNGAS